MTLLKDCYLLWFECFLRYKRQAPNTPMTPTRSSGTELGSGTLQIAVAHGTAAAVGVCEYARNARPKVSRTLESLIMMC